MEGTGRLNQIKKTLGTNANLHVVRNGSAAGM